MASSDSFAVAAHLHVVLRRKTGRVTDTEWMATNVAYAQEMVRFARERGQAEGHEDLLKLADRLAAEIPHMEQVQRKPLVEAAADALRRNREKQPVDASAPNAAREGRASGFLESTMNSVFGHTGEGASATTQAGAEGARYVGRLR